MPQILSINGLGLVSSSPSLTLTINRGQVVEVIFPQTAGLQPLDRLLEILSEGSLPESINFTGTRIIVSNKYIFRRDRWFIAEKTESIVQKVRKGWGAETLLFLVAYEPQRHWSTLDKTIKTRILICLTPFDGLCVIDMRSLDFSGSNSARELALKAASYGRSYLLLGQSREASSPSVSIIDRL